MSPGLGAEVLPCSLSLVGEEPGPLLAWLGLLGGVPPSCLQGEGRRTKRTFLPLPLDFLFLSYLLWSWPAWDGVSCPRMVSPTLTFGNPSTSVYQKQWRDFLGTLRSEREMSMRCRTRASQRGAEERERRSLAAQGRPITCADSPSACAIVDLPSFLADRESGDL